ncbi:hypothetical protein M8J77_024788 [Diaphorina citri]|nr:hypothetical protein M8J77_024788 [Diaphorina citri]
MLDIFSFPEKALVLADRSLKKTSSSTCLESPKSDLSSLSMASSSYVTPMSPSVVLSTTSPISLDGMSSSSTSALVPYQASYARQKYSSTPSPMSLGAMSPSSALVPYQASNIRHKYSCKHCKAYTTYNITEIIYHGKTCTYMLRPNLYKFKYVCYECNFGAYQIAHLKRHIYTHTGEKPYNCMYCSYSSTHKYNIQKHIKVHTKLVLVKSASSFFRNDQFDSPQTCIHCHLFQTLDLKQLLAHCKVCPLDRPSESSHRFMCYACAYHTYDSGHMRRHIMAHNALKPYWCPYCNYSSVQHAHLKRHLRKHLNKHFLDTQTS